MVFSYWNALGGLLYWITCRLRSSENLGLDGARAQFCFSLDFRNLLVELLLEARLWGVVPPIFGNGGHPVPCGLHYVQCFDAVDSIAF